MAKVNDNSAAVGRLFYQIRDQRDEAQAEVARLTAWILEADSAFAVNGANSTSLDDCLGLVRMCHEGRAAIDEVARLRSILVDVLDMAHDMIGVLDCDDTGHAETLAEVSE